MKKYSLFIFLTLFSISKSSLSSSSATKDHAEAEHKACMSKMADDYQLCYRRLGDHLAQYSITGWVKASIKKCSIAYKASLDKCNIDYRESLRTARAKKPAPTD